MERILKDKRWIGVISAIIICAVFVGISLTVMNFMHGVPWFIFSSVMRIVFGVAILLLGKKIYGRSPKELLSFSNNKTALISGIGFFLYVIYDIITIAAGVESFAKFSVGMLLCQVLFQQMTTGFYEELHYRFLLLEGYSHGEKTAGRKILYAMMSFVLFGALHVVDSMSLYRFLQTGAIGFAFAVIYLNSGNIIIPMILHAVYDILTHLTRYINWNNSALFTTLNNFFIAAILVVFIVSFAMIFMKDKEDPAASRTSP